MGSAEKRMRQQLQLRVSAMESAVSQIEDIGLDEFKATLKRLDSGNADQLWVNTVTAFKKEMSAILGEKIVLNVLLAYLDNLPDGSDIPTQEDVDEWYYRFTEKLNATVYDKDIDLQMIKDALKDDYGLFVPFEGEKNE